jgi:hypothetical protein
MLEYKRVLKMDRQGLVGFGRNGVFRRQMYQHRGSGLDIVSFWFRGAEYKPLARHHIPRNSTQLISISFLSPSADNGRSSSRLRNTNGPASGRCFLVIGFSGSCSSILKQSALKLPSLHTSGHMPALTGQFATEWWWNEVGRAGYHFEGRGRDLEQTEQTLIKSHPHIDFTDCLHSINFAAAFTTVKHEISSTNKQALLLLVISITSSYA